MNTIRGTIVAALSLAALAIAPAAASASFVADEYPVTLDGATNLITVGASGAEVSCYFDFDADLEEASTTIAHTGEDPSECSANSEFKTNECQFELHNDFAGDSTLSIGPPECGAMTLQHGGCPFKPFKVPPQSGIDIEIYNTGEESEAGLSVDIAADDLEYVGDGWCKEEKLQKGFVLDASIPIGAVDAEDEDVGVHVYSGWLDISGWPEEATKVRAGEYPVPVTGGLASGPITLLEAEELTFSCDTAEYDAGELTEAAAGLTVDAVYSGCKVANLYADVHMNSCQYVYSNFEYAEQVYSEEEGGFIGTTDVVCDEGDEITLEMKTQPEKSSLCTLGIPAQRLSEGLPVYNQGTIFTGNVPQNDVLGLTAQFAESDVEYNVNGPAFLCGLSGFEMGTHTDGAAEYDVRLEADYSG